jgi:hypothetical protein
MDIERDEAIATPQQIAVALRKLTAYVPRGVPQDSTLALYARELAGVSYHRLLAGFGALKTEAWFPSLGQILRATGVRIPNEEAIEAVSVNLVGFLINRSPLCPAARAVFERSGGLAAFEAIGLGKDPVRDVRPRVVAAFDAGLSCSASDLELPAPAKALPEREVAQQEHEPITPEQRVILIREIRALTRRMRLSSTPLQQSEHEEMANVDSL